MAGWIVGFAIAAFCLWLGVRIFNRREKWAKRTAATMVPFAIYAAAYWVMMQPRLAHWRPAGGFGMTAIATPEYRLWKDCRLARPQRVWQGLFAPLFAIHRRIDENWGQFRPPANSPLYFMVNDQEAIAELEAGTAWTIDDFGRMAFSNQNQWYYHRQ